MNFFDRQVLERPRDGPANCLVVFDGSKQSFVSRSTSRRFFWVVSALRSHFEKTFCKTLHLPHISDIASKIDIWGSKKTWRKKLKISKLCRNTLRWSYERLACLNRLRNVSDIAHTAHQDRLFRIFATFLPFRRYLRVKKKVDEKCGKCQNFSETRSWAHTSVWST